MSIKICPKVLVLGAGLGGQMITSYLKQEFPSLNITCIGKKDSRRPGLFYFNERIPGICDKEIQVTYDKLGTGSFEDYQVKSRGVVDPSIKTSSFSNVGKTVTGYLQSCETSLETVPVMIDEINLVDKYVKAEDQVFYYDYLISTIPLKIFLKCCHMFTPDLSDEFKQMPVYQFKVGQDFCDTDITSVKVFYDTTDSVFYRTTSYYVGDEVASVVSESIIDFAGRTSVCVPGKILPSQLLTDRVKQLEQDYPEIKLCGRYARWDYHYTIDKSCFDAYRFIRSCGLTSTF